MKYNDKMTLRSYAKQQEKYDIEKSDRAKRREADREYQKFITKFYNYIEREWWDSIDDKIKRSLYSEWNYIKLASKGSEDFEKWVKIIRKDIKPNYTIYREKIINKILNQ